ncbi:isopentenyl phosphate kinase [Halorhabdus tiamatea]|uniref:Isopentenyl phosphate kinase n=2 Tax=Halorhabdus tiamatea SARL4B TaxID=1033806 RepID=F7PNK3_9EURY|nr:isopentenyl phosphate kinase [Halorhabdus tiamatea]CCQ33760.1 aspartate/glutamate/uridylate kinase [Halorhabdus tiamatea SARL4B]
MTTILKLGGSVITEKDAPETVDREALTAAADAIGAADLDDLVIVHGGGSFGHHHAEAHGVTATAGTHDAAGVYAIHDAMARLDDHVVEALQDAGVPALPVHPFSVASRDEHGETALPTGAIDRLRGEGFVPVLFGDVVVQAGAGATILSGDEIVVLLARSLGADRIGLCSGVSGVLDESGAVIDRIEDFAAVADALGESEATDVTGGMAGKVRALLDLETPASIFGPDDLAAFLAGEDPGTLIE